MNMAMTKIEMWVGAEGLVVKYGAEAGQFYSKDDALNVLKEKLTEEVLLHMQMFEHLALQHAKSYNLPKGKCLAPKCPWCFPVESEQEPHWVSDLREGNQILSP